MGMDGGRMPMVAIIKRMQQKSEQFRTCWKSYATLWGTGMHDPSRYDEAFLTEFLDYVAELANNDMQAHAAPSGVSLEQAVAQGTKRGADEFGETGAPFKRAATSDWAEIDTSSGDKGAFVTKIKAMQRADHSLKEAWWKYCDEWLSGVRDPNRHEPETLQQFITD